MNPQILTDEQWTLLEPLIPPPPDAARGRPPQPPRPILEAILWKIATDTPWMELPEGAPPWQTCYRRYCQWQHTGLFQRLLSILQTDLCTRGGFDIRQAYYQGFILFHFQGRRLTVEIAPHLQGTWQHNTALIFLALILKRIRQHPRFPHFRLPSPDP